MSRPAHDRFQRVAGIIDAAVAQRVTPAATIEAGNSDDVLWTYGAGRLTYATDAPRCTIDTIFDLASLTKVMAATSIAMRVHDVDASWIDTPLSALEPRWRGGARDIVTVRHLLDHSSGLDAH